MTEQDIDVLIRLWEGGNTVSTIIRMLPYKRSEITDTIANLRQKGVLKGKNGKSRVSARDVVLSAYKDGITNPYEIAEMLGKKPETIQWILKGAKLNRTRPKHNYKTCEKTRLIREDINNGLSTRVIIEKHGVSRQWINFIKHKYKEDDDDKQ